MRARKEKEAEMAKTEEVVVRIPPRPVAVVEAIAEVKAVAIEEEAAEADMAGAAVATIVEDSSRGDVEVPVDRCEDAEGAEVQGLAISPTERRTWHFDA